MVRAAMRIVERVRLWFREGRSDKVYEVDLVEVASGQYVVNFRFGRRGTALRDGTKTPLPLPLDKARAVFAALVAEKERGGYRRQADETASADAAGDAPAASSAATPSSSQQILLAELARAGRGQQPLRLVVRKVGDRAIFEAEPLLLELLSSGFAPPGVNPAAFRHGVVAAIARCGSVVALPKLRSLADDKKTARHLRDLATLALSMLGGADERRKAWDAVPAQLRPENAADVPAKLQALEAALVDAPPRAHAAVVGLYAATPIDMAQATEQERAARSVVLGAARVAWMKDEDLGLLRTLNWAAELRRDGELFALVTRRFETGQHRGDPKTLSYFKRRATRSLRRLGNLGSPDYARMATELLLAYADEDADEVIQGDWGTWDAFGPFYALNFVLYGRSPRYERASHRSATWRCKASYRPGAPAPDVREESYPELWDDAPELLWRLGTSKAAGIIVHFAARALREQTSFLSQVADDALAYAMSEARPVMRQLAFDVARNRAPNPMLACGALAAELEAADAWVLAWLQTTPSILSRELELLARVVTAKGASIRAALPTLTRDLSLPALAQRDLVTRAVAILMQLEGEPLGSERARAATPILLALAGPALDSLGVDVLRDLVAHPLAGVAEFGAELFWRRAGQAGLGHGLVDALLASPHPGVRSIGARFVAATPVGTIKDEPDLLVHFALSENAELRAGTRALLGEVARQFPEVGRRLATALLDALLTPQSAGVPAHVVALLRTELRQCLPPRDAAGVLALVGALSPHAREAGGLMLEQLSPDDLELDVIVRLASHEILAVRQGAWALARAAKARFRIAPVALARLCDASWDDSRSFAFDFVRGFAPADLVPDVVIAICDSVKPLVQQFGQELLKQLFREEHAERYLLRLSEHPSVNIQLLVSGLLDRYAHGKLEVLRQLLPCLLSILSQVNRGGVAKERVLAFVRKEAQHSAEAAALLAPLLERQSLTRAVSHRAPLIATMVSVAQRYPAVPLPIKTRATYPGQGGKHGV